MIRAEPSQKALKARNPVAPDAKQRLVESQRKAGSKEKQLQQKSLKQVLGNGDDDS